MNVLKLVFIVIITTSLGATNSYAANTGTGTVRTIQVKGNSVIFNLKEEANGCSTAQNHWYSFDLVSEGTRAWYELVTAAAYSGEEISVKLSEPCWSDTSSGNHLERDVLFITQKWVR